MSELAGSSAAHRGEVRVLTLDDDLEYHPDVVATLVDCNALVACLRGFDMKVRRPSDLLTWEYSRRKRVSAGSSVFHFSTGVGGDLYTPSIFDELLEVFVDDALYLECCPTNDDIWFNFLRIVKGVPMTVVDAPYVERDLTNSSTALWQAFNFELNNRQIRATAARLQQIGLL